MSGRGEWESVMGVESTGACGVVVVVVVGVVMAAEVRGVKSGEAVKERRREEGGVELREGRGSNGSCFKGGMPEKDGMEGSSVSEM